MGPYFRQWPIDWFAFSIRSPTQDNRQAHGGSGLYEEASLADYSTLVEKNGRLTAKARYA